MTSKRRGGASSSRSWRRGIAVLTVVLTATLMAAGAWFKVLHAGHDLQVTFGPQGLERVVYRGQVMADAARGRNEGFHIWHMQATDAHGQKMTAGEYGWGEDSLSKTWDLAEQTWTYRFTWGQIRARYAQVGDTLNIMVTEENRAGSGVTFDGATIYPLVLHLPETPSGFEGAAPRLTDNDQEPGVTTAEFGSGTVGVLAGDAKTLYSGLEVQPPPAGAAERNVYAVTASSVVPDSIKDAQSKRPGLPAGATDTFTISVRFARAGTGAAELGSDAYGRFAARWPMTLKWPDRRAIGTVYLASSPAGTTEQDERNPRRYFFGQTGQRFDVRTPQGLAAFQARVLTQAGIAAQNSRKLNAQAVITWDLEGEEFPQDTSYVCAPDQIAEIAPEMEATIVDAKLPYTGMKLDDAYFKVMRDAGLRVGVCVRPQHFTRAGDVARQVTLPEGQVAAELIRKMRYAHDRWGATVFYLDSTVRLDGRPLSADVLEKAAAALPDSLLIPEETTTRAYRSTAPFLSFLFHGDVKTPARVRAMYPSGFSANLVNDVSPDKLSAMREDLTDAVKGGDVLMVHADSWHVNNGSVISMYQDAKQR